jgi:hypothetical protein
VERSGSLWSIAIYTGKTPLELSPSVAAENPVLTADSVHDIAAEFVADPFMTRVDGLWHLFCEVKNRSTKLGEIGLATSTDGIDWTYRHTVLREPFHLSYPQVFEWGETYWMVPETLALNAVTLYRSTDFPTRWERVQTLLPGMFADPTLFRHEGYWWMFACPNPYRHDTLSLFYARELEGPWQPHSANPLLACAPDRARQGGPVTRWNNRLIRYAQDCLPVYGTRLRAFEITEINQMRYAEQEVAESPVLTPDTVEGAWNRTGMHHADPHQLADSTWIACVDGYDYVEPQVKDAVFQNR